MSEQNWKEVEVSVLGSILLDPNRVAGLCVDKKLESASFSPLNRRIFDQCISMFKAGEPIDSLVISDRMAGDEELSLEGGSKYFDKLCDDTPTSAHAEYYIDLLIEKQKRRHLLEIATAIKREVNENEKSATDISSLISSEVMKIGDWNPCRTKEEIRAQHKIKRNAAKSGKSTGFESRWNMEDGLGYLINSYSPPDNIIVAAKPSTGKTVLMLNEFVRKAENGIPVGIFSLDMTEDALRLRMAGEMADVNTFKFGKNYWTEEEAAKLDAAWDKIDALPIFINDNSSGTIDDIVSWTTAMVMKNKIRFLGVDFLQQINRTKSEYSMDFRLVVGEWSKKIKSLGKKFDLVTMVLSQLTRYGEKASEVTPAHPTLECLKESGDIENNADKVIMLAKSPGLPIQNFTYKHPVWDVDFIVSKQRDGPTGVVCMCLIPSRGRFVERIKGELLRDEINMKQKE